MDVARLHFEDRRAGLPALPQAEGRRQGDRTTQRQPGRALRVRCGLSPYGKYPRLFDVGPARAHLEGSVDSVSCPVRAFDERNRALHGYIQESLF